MSIKQFPGGIVTKNPTAPAGPYEDGAAPGIWTLDQAIGYIKQGIWPTAGNVPFYIEDMFSTWLYTGSASTQTITNNINLSGKGGLVWLKCRNSAFNNLLFDTVRGDFEISSNTTAAQANNSRGFVPLSTGFSLNGGENVTNNTGNNYTSWTFRKQPKFFDIVTYTGTGAVQNIAHNLGSVPGCVITKKTSATSNWAVYHRGITSSQNGAIILNLPDAFVTSAAVWNNTAPTSTQFTVGTADATNISGQTYVAYLFAHDAGGFGLTGTDNVVSCGSFTTDGTGAAGNITLGYEAQWLLIKRSDGVGSWNIIDVMRGSSLTSYNYLQPNASTQESSSTSAGQGIFPTATGFFVGTNFPAASATYIYVAVRRGPMKVPTLGTSVFSVDTTTADSAITSTLKQTDMGWFKDRTTVANWFVADRLRGFTNAYYTPTLYTNLTNAEATPTTGDTVTAFGPTTTGVNNGVIYAGGAGVAGNYPLLYSFKRAPGFFDEVCYTGTSSTPSNKSHNLNIPPELIIIKSRSSIGEWFVGFSFTATDVNIIYLNQSNAAAGSLPYASSSYFRAAPTSTTFTTSSDSNVNSSARTYTAYLFATVAGVSKVGSYTGTGALQTVACGFTSGARFVLIKRTDATGDWYVWDSARGLSSGTDPYLLLNSTAAEVTGTNYVDTDTTGFKVNTAAPAALNASGGNYIFLAIA